MAFASPQVNPAITTRETKQWLVGVFVFQTVRQFVWLGVLREEISSCYRQYRHRMHWNRLTPGTAINEAIKLAQPPTISKM
ncbi:hypothetical protein [Coxiella burnetii]|uniref:hypothetical protein n=1 Tax=Coxiella burnetii TaxID=777 RepID=UPI0012D30794|nr:hypothetical protein [Coxiella burnetii]